MPDSLSLSSVVAIKRFLACDLGAESGRVMLGTLADGALILEELHRFLNEPVQLPTGLYWDTLRLFHEIVTGLRVAGRTRKLAVDGIGIDTWGVDFGILGDDGALVDNPRHYRDPRNNGMMEKMCAVVPREEIFAQTGIQFMQINSLCQLHALALANGGVLERAATLLFIPDLLNYWLTGVKKAEVTIASTSQFYDPARRTWASPILDRLSIPAKMLPEIVEPGVALGPLLNAVADHTGLGPATVYASAGHDTAAAVAAVPAQDSDFCYISSGTWSLMGVELDAPLINEQSLALNFTNEAGVAGTIRLLKNIAGLWLLQECRRAWALEGNKYSYEELTQAAAGAEPYPGYIHPDAFLEPGHMPEKITAYCESTGQPVPADHGAMARAILEGLARRYREVLENLESLTGRRFNVIHIVGGGSRNKLLNQLAANATGRVVLAGPTEATAIGNVLVQAIGAGVIPDLASARRLVSSSFPVDRFEPVL
jgi:rhamnulokinase